MKNLNRRAILKSTSALALGALIPATALAAEPILIGIAATLSGPVGVADHQDWTNGMTLAIEEINAEGGINGRMLETKIVDTDILTPEGTAAAFQNLAEAGVHTITSAFVLIPQVSMDAAAATSIPYLHGSTSTNALNVFRSDPEKHRNTFQMDVAEVWYGSGFINFITDLKASGDWTPKNNKVHIVQGQIAYTQLISQGTQKSIAESGGEWELAAITDVQFPVQDWSPVLAALQETDAGTIMIDHWVAAELAAFTQNFASDPVEGALVYLQYGPSQPEFLDLSGEASEGFVWGTVYGTYNDAQGAAFREKYKARFPGTMGLVYSGGGYDTVQMLAAAWRENDPSDFDAVGNAIRGMKYRGTCGLYKFDNDSQSGTSYPNQTDDSEGGQAHLFFQVQDGEHKIIAPSPFNESKFRKAHWM